MSGLLRLKSKSLKTFSKKNLGFSLAVILLASCYYFHPPWYEYQLSVVNGLINNGTSVVSDVYVWCYTLLEMHDRFKKKNCACTAPDYLSELCRSNAEDAARS